MYFIKNKVNIFNYNVLSILYQYSSYFPVDFILPKGVFLFVYFYFLFTPPVA